MRVHMPVGPSTHIVRLAVPQEWTMEGLEGGTAVRRLLLW
jgi:hypothetical protein